MTKYFLTIALLLSAGVAAANPQPNLPSVSNPPTAPAASTAPAEPPSQPVEVASTAITPEKLGTMLADLGYEVKDISVDGKKDYYQIVSEREGWKIFITVSLSTDQTLVWLGVKFAPLPNAAAASPEAWLKLLELTQTHYPVHFALDETSRIRIWLPIENVEVDLNRLRTEIEGFDDVVRTSASHCAAANFTGAAPATP